MPKLKTANNIELVNYVKHDETALVPVKDDLDLGLESIYSRSLAGESKFVPIDGKSKKSNYHSDLNSDRPSIIK